MFSAMCDCQALHPDPEDADSDNEEFEGEEEEEEETGKASVLKWVFHSVSYAFSNILTHTAHCCALSLPIHVKARVTYPRSTHTKRVCRTWPQRARPRCKDSKGCSLSPSRNSSTWLEFAPMSHPLSLKVCDVRRTDVESTLNQEVKCSA